LTQVLKALTGEKQGRPVEGGPAVAIANSLASGKNVAVLLGNFAQQHPHAAQLHALAQQIAALCEGKLGFLGEAANSAGGYLANALPGANALNASSMLSSPRKAYVLLNVEPELDCANPQQAIAAMLAADTVIVMSAYKHRAAEYADVLLPITPFTETSGTFVSTEGRLQSFKGAVKPLGEARPAWKVLRVLGNLLKLEGFNLDTSEAVRDEALKGVEIAGKLNNAIGDVDTKPVTVTGGLQRVSEVPIYSTDAVVRRSMALQATADAATPKVWLNGDLLKKLGVNAGAIVKVSQGQGSVNLIADLDDRLPGGVVRVAAGHSATAALGAMFGTISVERT
jgi:NADH-quinone oxidoreductase subunit G